MKGEKVLFDFDLALLYGVELRVLNQAVRRNLRRFPKDFLITLTMREWSSLRSQIVILEKGRGKFAKYPPIAFTEQGVAMLSSVLNSDRAIDVNIIIMRTFVALRKWMQSNKDLEIKIGKLEAKYDLQFKIIFEAIRQLIREDNQAIKPIGFKIPSKS